MLDSWIKSGRYYQLNLVSGDHQNPEGRLTEDLRTSADAPVDFAVGSVEAVVPEGQQERLNQHSKSTFRPKRKSIRRQKD